MRTEPSTFLDGFSEVAMQTATGVQKNRRTFKLRGGTKLVVGSVLVLGAGYLSWNFGVGYWLSNQHFSPLKPSKVCLLGLKTGKGFTIQVSNRIAQLVEAKDHDFSAPGQDNESGDADGAIKKRLPVDDLVYSLEGNEASLSKFVTSVGGFNQQDEWPPNAPVWAAEDIKKAIDGDARLRGKLEQALATQLDGSAVDQLSTSALSKGIIVETPTPVRVMVGGEQVTLQARVKRWYQTHLASETAAKYKELFEVSAQAKLAYYMATAKEQLGANHLENVKAALTGLISSSGLKDAADKSELILGSATVILTDPFIDSASVTPSAIGDASSNSSGSAMFDLDIKVNDEGRMRLWQYSKMHPRDQLLLVSNGVAIAAPRIRQELMTHDLTVVQMPDEGLVREAAQFINEKK